MKVIGTSVTPKCESRTWRKASARNAAATNAVGRPKSRVPMRKTSQTLITPAAALRRRATIRCADIVGSDSPRRMFSRDSIAGAVRKANQSVAATASMKSGG